MLGLACDAGFAVGFGVEIPAPAPPGMISTWPTIRLRSVSPLKAMTSSAETPVRAEMASSVSPSAMVTTSPVTGGMSSRWPIVRSCFDLRSLAHQMDIIVTPKWLAIPVSVSPDFTL